MITKASYEILLFWFYIIFFSFSQSPAFEYTTGPIMCMESKEMRDAKNVAKAKQKENKKDDKEEDSSFKKELYQKILVNGTLQGLEDVLAAKYDEGVTPGVLFACDELSVLFSNLEKDATFDSTFLMLYTAKVIYIFFPQQFKILKIDVHLKWLNIQREGFTNLGEIIVGWYSYFFYRQKNGVFTNFRPFIVHYSDILNISVSEDKHQKLWTSWYCQP